jgi:hypothetical protein
MSLKLHSTILATSLAATLAVGFAGAAMVVDHQTLAAPKSDRLPIVATVPAGDTITIEMRHDGVSDLQRIPLN